jgi:hypothetical protein
MYMYVVHLALSYHASMLSLLSVSETEQEMENSVRDNNSSGIVYLSWCDALQLLKPGWSSNA